PRVPARVGTAGVPGAAAASHRAAAEGVEAAPGEELAGAGPEAPAGEGGPAVARAVERRLAGAAGQRPGVGPAWLGADRHGGCAGRRVLFTTCALLVQDLLAAKRDLTLKALRKRLGQYEALVIDDLGYVQQSREEMEVLFTLLAERYERGSVLVTSNLPFSKWEQVFKDPMTAAAAIDRLVHHSIIVELNVPSYRAEVAKKAKAALAE